MSSLHAREEIVECAPTVDSPAAIATLVYSGVGCISTDGNCKALGGSFHGRQKFGHGGLGETSEYT